MKYLKFFVVLLIFLLMQAHPILPQNHKIIKGNVIDKTTGKPLIGANIVVEETTIGTSTDTNGQFQLNLPPGSYILSVGYIGYHVAKIRVNVVPNSKEINFELTPQVLQGHEVIAIAERAKERETPVAFTDISRKELQTNYWAQDIPMLISETPGVFSYSDAGNGIGYTYLKIRGFDQKRVSVMINGIPLNDPEDHQVYWVDMPDFAASVHDIQIQRGVGSSLYGSASFGGTVNIITNELNIPQKLSVTSGMGSYQTKKFSVNMNSGLINNKYAFSSRFSKITTDGYRDNSAVDLWSYFFSAARYGLKTKTKINVYGGPELTHAAWEASPESILKLNHKHNPITYKNTVDNFNQPHYELLHEWLVSKNIIFSNTLFYIHGKGYYEAFKTEENLTDYGFDNYQTFDSQLFGADSLDYYQTADKTGNEVLARDENGKYTLTSTDLVRQKWVSKDQVGWITRLDWEHNNGTFTFGGDFYTFKSDHWGKVIWAAQLPANSNADHTYHQYYGAKNFGTLFLHELYRLSPKTTVMGDFNIQIQKYRFKQKEVGGFSGINRHAYDIDYTFFNPRVGINYNLSDEFNFYANVSVAHLEPSDSDQFDLWQGPDDVGVNPLFAKADTMYKSNGTVDYLKWNDPLTKPEQLLDYEIGGGYRNNWLQAKINVYWMNFNNEIVPYGQADKNGFPVKGNAERTVHRGIESSADIQVTPQLLISGSLTLSQNYFSDFNQYEAVYDDNWNFLASTTTDYSGKTIAGFPGIMANGKVNYSIGALSSSLQVQHVGKQYLDNSELDERSIDAFTLVNLKLAYHLQNTLGFDGLTFSFWMNNLFDIQYETAGYYDSWAGENYLWPGAGRNFFINMEFGL